MDRTEHTRGNAGDETLPLTVDTMLSDRARTNHQLRKRNPRELAQLVRDFDVAMSEGREAPPQCLAVEQWCVQSVIVSMGTQRLGEYGMTQSEEFRRLQEMQSAIDWREYHRARAV